MTTWTLELAIPTLGNTLTYQWSPVGTPTANVGDALSVVLTNPPSSDVTLNLSWAAKAGNPNPPVVGWNGTLTGSQMEWNGFLLNQTAFSYKPDGEYTFRAIVTVDPTGSPTTYTADPEMVVGENEGGGGGDSDSAAAKP